MQFKKKSSLETTFYGFSTVIIVSKKLQIGLLNQYCSTLMEISAEIPRVLWASLRSQGKAEKGFKSILWYKKGASFVLASLRLMPHLYWGRFPMIYHVFLHQEGGKHWKRRSGRDPSHQRVI